MIPLQKLYCIHFQSIIVLNYSFAQKTENQIRIAFGSCGHQDHKLPVFNTIADRNPDYFIFLGDNIYGDTDDMKVLKSKYNKLGNKKSYKNLKIMSNFENYLVKRISAEKKLSNLLEFPSYIEIRIGYNILILRIKKNRICISK